MIKQITTFTNLKNKYGWLNGSYLFFTRYISRNKYYAILIEKLKQEFRTEIEDIKITSKSCSNNKLDEMNTCIIWILWYQGYEKMPKLVKKCYNSLLKNVKSDKYKIILLDNKNIEKYVEIPENILEKYKEGKITNTHLSDLIRILLLSQYGGIWVDSTCYFINAINDNLTKYSFISPKTGKENKFFNEGKWSVYFMGMGENNCIAAFMAELFNAYWEKNDYMCDYFLIDILMKIGYEEIPEIKEQIDTVPINNDNTMYVLNHWNEKYESNFREKISDCLFIKLDWRREKRYRKYSVGEYVNEELLGNKTAFEERVKK